MVNCKSFQSNIDENRNPKQRQHHFQYFQMTLEISQSGILKRVSFRLGYIKLYSIVGLPESTLYRLENHLWDFLNRKLTYQL
jgi:hypothetical protein